jgi:putative flavoprotein involved in K+ transport
MPPLDDAASVLIIGGGAAGLSAAAALAARGIRSTVLDQDCRIGGSWARRYQSLKLHTIRRYSGLPHYPIPKDKPRYLSKDDYAAYLKQYAEVLGLDVCLGERVESVQRPSDSTSGSRWQVRTNRNTRQASAIVIATGNCAEPRLPVWDGTEEYTGVVLHSSQYTTGIAYKGKKTLVIGLGNSGAEIAADLATHGAGPVSVSVRTTPPIVTREMFGLVPVQLLGIVLTPLGMPRLFDRIGTALRRMSVGDLARYGLGQAAWGPFTARRPAVIDAGFLKNLQQGRIVIRPQVKRFETTAVIYTDGSREAPDVVIAATGFRTGLEMLLDIPGVIDDSGRPRFQSGQATSVPGLYFAGFDETVRGTLFEINRQSRPLAGEIATHLAQIKPRK